MRLRDLFQAESFSGTALRTKFGRAGFIALFFYLVAGFIYSAILPPETRFPDEEEYLKLSYYLVQGPGYSMDGIHLTASRPPGYAFFLAGVRALGGDTFGIRFTQFLLLSATIFLVYRLCSKQKIFAGLLLVTGLVICYPVLFFTSSTLYPQTLSAFLFVLSLTLLLADGRGLVLNAATGFTFGALILVVPTFLLTMIVVLGVSRVLKIIRWRDALLVFLAAALMIGAWTARNAVCFHRFVPVSTNSGLNLLMGNNPKASPYEAGATAAMIPYYRAADKLGLDEFETDLYYRKAALNWIKAHPWDAVVLYFKKVLNFFNIVNVYAPDIGAEVSPLRQGVIAVEYLLLMGLLGWRLIDIKRFPLLTREKLFLAVYVLSAFTSAVFFTRIRLRLPYEYLIIAIVAVYLSRRLEHWIESGRAGKIPVSDPVRKTGGASSP